MTNKSSENIPSMFGRVWTAPPEDVFWDMYENDASFDKASQTAMDRSMADEVDFFEDDDFYDLEELEKDDPDAVEKAIYQTNVAMETGQDTSGINTPYGPGLTMDEIDRMAEIYPGIKSGAEVIDDPSYFVNLKKILESSHKELDAIIDAVEGRTEKEGRIGEESSFWSSIGDQLGDALSMGVDVFKDTASNIAELFTEGFETRGEVALAKAEASAGGYQDIGGRISGFGDFVEKGLGRYGELAGEIDMPAGFDVTPLDRELSQLWTEDNQIIKDNIDLWELNPSEAKSFLNSPIFASGARNEGKTPEEIDDIRTHLQGIVGIGEPTVGPSEMGPSEMDMLAGGTWGIDTPTVDPSEEDLLAGEFGDIDTSAVDPSLIEAQEIDRIMGGRDVTATPLDPSAAWSTVGAGTEAVDGVDTGTGTRADDGDALQQAITEAGEDTDVDAEGWAAKHSANLRKIFYTRAYAYPGAGRAEEQQNLSALYEDTKNLFFLFGGSNIWGAVENPFKKSADQLYTPEKLLEGGAEYDDELRNIEGVYGQFLKLYFNNPSQFRRGSAFRKRINIFQRIIGMDMLEHAELTNKKIKGIRISQEDQDVLDNYYVAKGLFAGTANSSGRERLIELSITNGSRDYYASQIHSAARKVMQYYKNIGKTDADIFSIMTGSAGAKAAIDVKEQKKNVPVAAAEAAQKAGDPRARVLGGPEDEEQRIFQPEILGTDGIDGDPGMFDPRARVPGSPEAFDLQRYAIPQLTPPDDLDFAMEQDPSLMGFDPLGWGTEIPNYLRSTGDPLEADIYDEMTKYTQDMRW